MTTVLEVMAPWETEVRKLVGTAGEDFDTFVRYLEQCTSFNRLPVRAEAKRGEQVVIWDETDGVGGLDLVASMLKQSESEGGHLHLIVSGGDTSVDTRDNMPALLMVDRLREATGLGADGSRITIDGFSRHTGHQGRILPQLLKALGAKEVAIVLPIYHIPRAIATWLSGLVRFAGIAEGVKVFPMPFGTWENRHRCKMPWRQDGDYSQVGGFTYAELAFAPHLPQFRFEDPGAENTSEVRKIVEGWDESKKLMCHHLRPADVLPFLAAD